jgi:Family of unknown function (DUF5808)
MKKDGEILGVPYDFRKPTWSLVKERMWNPQDERIWTPRLTGIGWSINLFQLKKRYPWAFYLLVVAFVFSMGRAVYRFFTTDYEE